MLALAPVEVDAGMAFKLRFYLDKKTEKADGQHSVSVDTDVVQEATCQHLLSHLLGPQNLEKSLGSHSEHPGNPALRRSQTGGRFPDGGEGSE